MDKIDNEQLKALQDYLDKTPFLKREDGDYWEEDENGVMWLKHKNGAPVLMMSKADYEEMKAYKPAQPYEPVLCTPSPDNPLAKSMKKALEGE